MADEKTREKGREEGQPEAERPFQHQEGQEAEQTETVVWATPENFDLSWIRAVKPAKRPVGNQGTLQPRKIKNILCAFDIETSPVPGYEQAAVYHWQMQIGKDRPTVHGRTLAEWRMFMDRIAEQLKDDETIYCFVHSLRYEFHFIRDVYEFTNDDIFALDRRKPVKVKLYGGKIELRCSYILTNMSLGEWTAKFNVPHKKLDSGEYDHTLVRFPWSELSPLEQEYCRNDVLGLVEALEIQLNLYGNTLADIPLTSTGYVRTDVKRCMKNWSFQGIQAVQPTDEVYVALRQAFRGGNTHANRYMAKFILANVKSYDRSSSYPDVCINRKFPMGAFKKSAAKTISHLRALIKLERAVLIRLSFTNLRLKYEREPCPYISYSKVWGITAKQCRLDNGRIINAPYCEMTITDIDWKIISETYTWDKITVLDMWDTRYGYLPDILRRLIISYYEKKTKLKGDEEQKLYYEKFKALLNAIYGLQAQDPCKPRTVYNPEPNPEKDEDMFELVESDIKKRLAKSRFNAYGSYQWGVWCTAHARNELQKVIKLAGENFVYCDTDSVKFVGDLDIESYNREQIELSKSNGAFATDKSGEIHFTGVYELDGVYNRFCTYGAKKYAYEDKKGLHVTIAGVSKKYGAKELAEHGGLEAFKTGFVFSKAGGTEAIYNDTSNLDVEIEGHKFHIGPNIYLKPSTYTVKLGKDYAELLDNDEWLRNLTHEHALEIALLAGDE